MAPWLSTFPVLPPSTRMPIELLTSVLLIVPPATTVTLLLLFRMTPAPFAFGVTVQPESTLMSEPPVAVPAAGHAASATLAKAEQRRNGDRGQQDSAHKKKTL